MGLRDQLKKKCSQNSEEFIKALKQSGADLTADQEKNFSKGNFENMSDEQLESLFTPKVLGSLGLDSKAF